MNEERIVGHLVKRENGKCKTGILIPESRCYKFGKTDNKWEGCEEAKRNGN